MPDLVVPESLRSRFADWSWTLWWHYPDVQTWKLEHSKGEILFLKVAEAARYPSIRDEAARMRWAATYIPVPKVIDTGRVGEVEWMLTEELRGTPAVDDALRANPAGLVPLLAKGLRRLHQLPVSECPFDFRLEKTMEHVRTRVANKSINQEGFNSEHRAISPEAALAELEASLPVNEDLVVCHGDYCFPNVLIERHEIVGFLDLGELGVADRWWDVAVGAWSCTWNVGPGWEDLFFRSYGVEPDSDRIRFYRLLYDMVS